MKRKNVKKALIALTGIVGLAIIAMGILFAASGIFSAPKYLDPWRKDYAMKFDDPRLQLAAHGLLAANGHNMQPWKIKLDKADSNVFYLYADSERLTKEVDPFARQTMVTQGTFLEYVKVAGEKLGYQTDIRLFPDGQYDETKLSESMKTKPVAKITLKKTEPQNSPLYEYIFLADTNRDGYQPDPLTPEQIGKLTIAYLDQDLTIKVFQDEENNKSLGNYAMEGAKIESGIHRINEESSPFFRANEYQKNKYRYGFSLEGQGITGIKKHILQGMLTISPSMNSEKASADMFVNSTKTAVENTPAYAMIISNTNDRVHQVMSGMAYSRLVLTAHSLGLVMQPPSQVLEEYPEMKKQYSSIHSEYAPNGGTIQMFFRVGKPTIEASLSMRRDVMELIEGN